MDKKAFQRIEFNDIDNKYFAISMTMEGKEVKMEVTEDQAKRIQLWANDPHLMIQNALPDLTADQREFLLSGFSPEEWDELFFVDDEAY